MPMIAAGSLSGFAPLRSCGEVQYCSGSSSRLRTFLGGAPPGLFPPPVFVCLGEEREGEGSDVGAGGARRGFEWLKKKEEVVVEKKEQKRCC